MDEEQQKNRSIDKETERTEHNEKKEKKQTREKSRYNMAANTHPAACLRDRTEQKRAE